LEAWSEAAECEAEVDIEIPWVGLMVAELDIVELSVCSALELDGVDTSTVMPNVSFVCGFISE
jgi:hypothetical protein